MKKSLLLLLIPALILLPACQPSESSEPSSPTTASTYPVSSADGEELTGLQRVFNKLREGNFHVDYTMSYAASSTERTQTADYTEYAIQTDGFFGFNAVAQGDDLIFPYTIEDGKIESKAPQVNTYTGMRYTSISDYRLTFRDFDISYLPTTPDSDGYYTYRFGLNETNDRIVTQVCMLYTEGSSNPESIRMRTVGDSLITEGVGITYENGAKDTVVANFTQIGTTELSLIKDYLDSGGTAKEYVDDRFVYFMLPYFISQNYSAHIDLKGMTNTPYASTEYRMHFTPDAVYRYTDDYLEGSGFIQYTGTVFSYHLDEESDVVFDSQQMIDSSTSMSDLWYEEIQDSFLTLTPANLTGYMVETQEGTEYHLTDSQLIYTIAAMAAMPYDDSYSVSEAIVTIDDFDSNAFTVEFNYIDNSQHLDKGVGKISFYDLEETTNAPVDRLLYPGDDPREQSKEEFLKALGLFQTDRYSQYQLSSFGMYQVDYAPEYYFMHSTGQGYETGGGFAIDPSDQILKSVTVNSSGSVEVSTPAGYLLPGTGRTYMGNDDLGYISHPVAYLPSGAVDTETTQALQAALYDPENYSVYDYYDTPIWRNTDPELLSWVQSYFGPSFGSSMRIFAWGFRTSMAEEGESEKQNKLSVYFYLTDGGGDIYSTSVRFFNLGTARVEPLEDYVSRSEDQG